MDYQFPSVIILIVIHYLTIINNLSNGGYKMYKTIFNTTKNHKIIIIKSKPMTNKIQSLLKAAYELNHQSIVLFISFDNTENEILQRNQSIDQIHALHSHNRINQYELIDIINTFTNTYQFNQDITVIIDNAKMITCDEPFDVMVHKLSDVFGIDFIIRIQIPNL